MKRSFFAGCLLLVLVNSALCQNQKFTISGYVKEESSGELMPGVTVYIPKLDNGVITNSYGFYSITAPLGEYEIEFRSAGFEEKHVLVQLTKNVTQDILLVPSTISLDEVTVTTGYVEKTSESSQMSITSLSSKDVEFIPAILGEKDVLKALQLTPGIQSGTEGSSGLYVRGGGLDQNLIILDESIVYNANHLFGFFSIFNGDAIKSISLYKGGFPARFGGRLSSVVQIDTKDGNKEELHGKIGVGIVSSSFLLEGPIKKGKSSFIVSGRRTYADAFMGLLDDSEEKNRYNFFDWNSKFHHEFDGKNKLYLSFYFGGDRFKEQSNEDDSVYKLRWGNITSTLRWNHQFSKNVFSNTSFIFSRYRFKVEEEDGGYRLDYYSSIRDLGLKYDIDYYPFLNHAIKAGVSFLNHKFIPRALVTEGEIVPSDEEEVFETFESAFYLEDDMDITNSISANLGFRISHFIHNRKTYLKFEPRASMAFLLGDRQSLKASYSLMNQYVHLLSNSGVGLPTDLWVSSTDRVKPQTSQQIALGLVRDLDKAISITLEGYLKESENVISYKEGANFIQLDDPRSAQSVLWEDNITSGESFSRGMEIFIEKKSGRLNGWIGYTLSKTELQFEELNAGRKFLAQYDRRHDVSIVGNYHFSENLSLSGTWVYGSGNNFTLPVRTFRVAEDEYGGITEEIDSYEEIGEVNNFRAEAYHRMDLSLRTSKRKKKGVRTWEFSIYNVYNRKNPFFYERRESVVNESALSSDLVKFSYLVILPSIRYTYVF